MSEHESGAKVVGLRGTVLPDAPVPNVVAKLEELLERARSGDLRALAYATVHADRTCSWGWEKPTNPGQVVATDFETHALGGAVLTLGVRYGNC